MPELFRTEALIAYPFAAEGAAVKMQASFQIGVFKGAPVFPLPNHLPYPVVFNAGKPALGKPLRLACPFLPAAVAEKAESKVFFAGIIRCVPGQRNARGTSFHD